jgi:RNA-directed DNA polymerase
VEQFRRERGLELSPEKTTITHIAEGFDFLGQTVRKDDGKILIQPWKKSVKALLDKVRKVVKRHKQAKTGNLILHLNGLIRGWAQYQRHVASKETFAAVAAAVFRLVWCWARRRHPTKGARWVHKTYLRAQGHRRWVCTGTVPDAEGRRWPVRLYSALRLPLQRHVKVRHAANPYDPAWELYFEVRRAATMQRTLAGTRRHQTLREEQQGRCPICAQAITPQTGWHAQHLVWRSQGGSEDTANQVLLHPACHRRVHSQGLTVRKPCPTRGNRGARAG